MHAAVSPIAESPEASEEGSRAGTPANEPASHPAPAAGPAVPGHPGMGGTADAAPVHAAEPPAQLPKEPVGEAGQSAERLAPGSGTWPAPDAGPSLLAEEEEQDGNGAAEVSGVAALYVPDPAEALLAREEDKEEGGVGGGGLARLTKQLHAQLVLDASEPLLAAEEEQEQDDGDAAAAAAAAAAGEPGGMAEQQSTQLALDAADALLAAEEDEDEEEQAAGPAVAAAAGAPAGLLAHEDDEDATELTPLQQLMRMCCQEVRGNTC